MSIEFLPCLLIFPGESTNPRKKTVEEMGAVRTMPDRE